MNRLGIYRELHGDGNLHLDTQESAITNARRRIIAATDLKAGQIIAESDLIALRSNVGIEIYDWDKVVGAKIKTAVAAEAPIAWEDLEA